MLVLSRKEGERLLVGDDVTIVVSKVNGNRVSIGIEAPRHVKVVREELEIKADATMNERQPKATKAALSMSDFVATLETQRAAG